MNIYNYIQNTIQTKGAGFFILLDPGKTDTGSLINTVEAAQDYADAFLIGGSLFLDDVFDAAVKVVKNVTDKPVIIFPGSIRCISRHADAILFLSLISGRNPQYLIGDHAVSAPVIRAYNLEPVSTGYILVQSGSPTSVEFISGTRPVPRSKPQIAAAHALAGEYLGLKTIYLEGGSGADMAIPDEMIGAVKSIISIPLFVGGGITSPETAARIVEAGADIIVIGNAFERDSSSQLLSEFGSAIHTKR